jgi:hypothetical protein
MISNKDKTEQEEVMAEVIQYLMNKHFPGWDSRADEFDTFAEYTDWVGRCVDSIIILPEHLRRDQ